MKAGIHIEAKVPKDHVSEVADAISNVLLAAHDAHADQKTVRAALDVLQRGASIQGLNMNNCSVTG